MKHTLLSINLFLLLIGICHCSYAQTFSINKRQIEQPSTDNDEYFELAGPAGTSLDGFTYLVIGDGTGGSGVMEGIVNLTSPSIPADGFFLAAESIFTLDGAMADLTTNHNFKNSDNVTHLLVNGFTGSDGDNLDTDNGTLEVTPWSATEDRVTLVEDLASSERVYSNTQIGSSGTFVPAYVYRNPNTSDNFQIGKFAPTNSDDTPRTSNLVITPVVDNIIINEVDAETPSSDIAEFIELYDGGAGNTALDGLVVVFFNGSDDASYEAFDLDGFSTNSDGFFVLGNPGVANVDLVFEPGNSGALQNGADAVAVYQGDATDFPEDTPITTNNLLDAIVYGTSDSDDNGLLTGLGQDTQYDENVNSNQDNESNSRVSNGSGKFVAQTPTPGAANEDNNSGEGSEIGECGDEVTLISTVQGSGDTSPLVGQTVVIEGVVVGDFQSDDDEGPYTELNGFYLQEEGTDYDTDPLTSEGIFVRGTTDDVTVGQVVRVLGTVEEFERSGASQTQLSISSVLVCGTAAVPLPAQVTLPVTDRDFLERYEGMLVQFPQNLVISEYFNFDRFSEVVLAQPLPEEDRLYQPTAVHKPGSSEAAARDEYNQLARITLDDGRSSQNPFPARHPNGFAFDLNNSFRGGDQVQNAIGVLDNTFGVYRIQPTQGADFIKVNERPQNPKAVDGSLKVASFNVLNYFNTIDAIQDSRNNNDPADDVCGGNGDLECRGADNEEERERQLAKIVSAMIEIEADIFGLIEVENSPNVEAMEDIVIKLNDQFGVGVYDYINTGTISTDAIKVGIIYKTTAVAPKGSHAVLTEFEGRNFVDPRNGGPKNRPALAQTFEETATGGVFTVVVNHLKSKGSGCGAGDDDPQQGNCNGTRADAADILMDWIATDSTGSNDPDFMIIGDLNAYDKEDPIDQIKEGADDNAGTDDDFVDLNFEFGGEFAYSYLFGGEFGYLDYAMVNQSLFSQITGLTEWHINADEPGIWDYNIDFNNPHYYEENAFRASDHDPVIVGLDLKPSLPIAINPVCSANPKKFKRWEVTNNSDKPIRVRFRLFERSWSRVRSIKPGETKIVPFRTTRNNTATLLYSYKFESKKVNGESESSSEQCETKALIIKVNNKLTERNRYRIFGSVENPNKRRITLNYQVTDEKRKLINKGGQKHTESGYSTHKKES